MAPPCISTKIKLPRYSERRGWTGGDAKALYAITDKRTGRLSVLPVWGMRGVGPVATVRVATLEQAEAHWQAPLNANWKVACVRGPKVARGRGR